MVLVDWPMPKENIEGAPPHSVAAEEAVLGGVLKSPACIVRVADQLKPDDFYVPQNGKVWAGMLALQAEDKPIDYTTLAYELKRQGTYDEVGGLLYISQIDVSNPFGGIHVEHHAGIIVRTSLQRQIIGMAAKTAEKAYEPGADPEALVMDIERRLLALKQRADESDDSPTMAVAVARYRARLEATIENSKGQDPRHPRLVGLSSGLVDLDFLTLGFRRKTYTLLGARTGKGKSVLMLQWALHIAMRYGPTVYFSTEMSEEELMERAVSMLAGTNRDDLQMGTLAPDVMERVMQALATLEHTPIFFRTEQLTTDAIRMECLRVRQDHGPLAAVLVDYIQQLEDGNGLKRNEDLGRASRALARMAKQDFDCPVIAAAQLSRTLDSRRNPVPRLSDFRDSGNLEQDAHLVLALVRPDPEEADDDGNPAQEQDLTPRIYKLKDRNRSSTRTPGTSVRLAWSDRGERYYDEAPGLGYRGQRPRPAQVATRDVEPDPDTIPEADLAYAGVPDEFELEF